MTQSRWCQLHLQTNKLETSPTTRKPTRCRQDDECFASTSKRCHRKVSVSVVRICLELAVCQFSPGDHPCPVMNSLSPRSGGAKDTKDFITCRMCSTLFAALLSTSSGAIKRLFGDRAMSSTCSTLLSEKPSHSCSSSLILYMHTMTKGFTPHTSLVSAELISSPLS